MLLLENKQYRYGLVSENLNISLKTAAKSIQVGICSFLLNLTSEDQTEGHKSGTEKAINYFIDWSQPRFIFIRLVLATLYL